LNEGDRWLTEAIDRLLHDSTQSPDELRARALKLRARAAQSDMKGIRDAAQALADRYEQAAATRLSA
jgi:uncharacterized protein YceH (UPF0502 family)